MDWVIKLLAPWRGGGNLPALLLCALLALIDPASAAVTNCTPTAGFTACKRITFSGGDQAFTVPTGITSIEVRAWGAAGGGANASWWTGQGGGAGGGFAQGTLSVIAGQTLTIVVGQGGIPNSPASTYGGGGAGGNSVNTITRGGSGGGYSGVFAPGGKTAANARIIAGGGGGASPGADGAPFVGPGGGGGTSGGQDAVPTLSGRGGTQVAGGAAATQDSACGTLATAGAQFQGGSGASSTGIAQDEGGGGGGGGFFGGGGGTCQNSGNQNGGGGGGSSYIAGTGVSAASTTAGANFLYSGSACAGIASSGGATDPLYSAGVGEGSCYGTGGNGEVVIQYRIATLQLSKTSLGAVGGFSFSAGNGFGSETLTTLTSGVAVTGSVRPLDNSNTVTTVTEAVPPGYVLTSISCTGLGSGAATYNLSAGSVTLDALATMSTNDVNCAFTNELIAPALSVSKSASTAGPVSVGQVITYTFTVTNSGNVPLSGVAVSESFNGFGIPPSPANETLLTDNAPVGDSTDGTSNNGIWQTLGAGDVIRFTAPYTVTQTDIDNLQ
jgi:hypothetical protein